MTLSKTKPRAPSHAHRKRHAQHHKRSSRYMEPYWPYLPLVAVIVLGLTFSSWFGSMQHGVLGYATDMSTSALLSGTNSQRTANGLGSLALSATLSQAAQSKANDMVARDYWSHNTPDGQTPWTFIVAAGYSYQTAGENLAYGFTTAADTITGWMNSAGHRANILNTTFTQVGFGVANSANYQGSGPETVVVAMYALPVAAAPAPAPAPVATPTPAASSPTTSSSEPASSPTSTDTANQASGSSGGGTNEESMTETELPKNATRSSDSAAAAKQADTVTPKKVSRVQVLTAANVAWSQFAVSLLASVALLAFLLRHSFAWHKVLVQGERFVLHHPWLDVIFIAIMVAGVYLLQTVGTIR